MSQVKEGNDLHWKFNVGEDIDENIIGLQGERIDGDSRNFV